MKRVKIKEPGGERAFQLADNQIIVFENRALQIDCLLGMIWVTWPDGNERLLLKGQKVTAVSKGVICLQAFSASAIIARRVERRLLPLVFGYRRCGV